MRGHGEGTIFERADGRWCGQFQDSTGKRKTIYGKRKADVQKKLRGELTRVERCLPAHDNQLTVESFLDQWLEGIKPSVRERTYLNYSDMIRLHISPQIGRRKLTELSISDVQRLLSGITSKRDDKPISPKMVRHIHACLRAALNDAMRQELIYRNVAALVSAPKVETKEVKPMTEEQVRAFLESIKDNRLEALYHVAVRLGMRRGEILGLEWKDVDLDARTLRVTQQVQRIGKSLVVSAPKTERSRRTLPLTDDELVDVLRKHHARQREIRFRKGTSWPQNDLVFVSSDGTTLEPRNVLREFQALLAAAGLPRFRFHDLRHSAATIMLSNGVEMKAVADFIGDSYKVASETYTHTTQESLRDAGKRVEIALRKKAAL